jgi:DNA helicase-2/ATP-dependent DNA helicase PcrA
LLEGFARWRAQLLEKGHVVVAATVLEEIGYTDMWKQDKSTEPPGAWKT